MLQIILVIKFLTFVFAFWIAYVCYLIRHSRNSTQKKTKVKSLVVLGSGGHTREMCAVIETLSSAYEEFVFVVADTDQISAAKVEQLSKFSAKCSVERIPRSREVGQSYLSSVLTTINSTCHAAGIVWRAKPDLVLVNGPGTCIPICFVAALYDLLRLRSTAIVFVESICRVKALSLSGSLLYFFGIADDVIVHWPALKEKYGRVVVLRDIAS